MEKYQDLVTRFIKYVKTETRSNEDSNTVPSTPSQVEFAKALAQELRDLGLSDVKISPVSGYVLASIPSNLSPNVNVPTVGFIAHIDTADFNAHNVNPQIVKNYDGQAVISLDADGKYHLDPAEFPNLKNYAGHDLITTDGTTLLGADDKAGVAEIVSAAAYLLAHPEIKHGLIRIGFGPDEEIGQGAQHFDVNEFGADFAYTIDGGPLGELQYETFNAAQAKVTLLGKDVHPGTAKGIMINALKLAEAFDGQLPTNEVPEKTDGREGFFHLLSLNGTVEEAQMMYIIRDHDRQAFEDRKQMLLDIAQKMNAKYPTPRVIVDVQDEYYNMREVIAKDMTVVEIAEQAMKQLDIEPAIFPVRGGTDGSIISFKGLPTPNIFAGGENMHGRFEFVSTQVMEKACDVIVAIAKLTAQHQE
ncbi:peptidase T [Ligilactobacillus saerimneri]|uniref:peptidase T n=1 Tax=Ligilactobacillus saerimneri TaxID=228229 RepID=UPI0030CB425B